MIVVTGMHRSGTSLAANLLCGLGLDFGDQSDFFAADQWNEKGYFEQKDIVDLNHRIITRFRNSVGGFELLMSYAMYMRMPPVKGRESRAVKLKHSLIELGKKYNKKCVKDPRFCLTFRYWKKWSLPDFCVVCLRHPFEVAMSLRRRQSVPLSLGFRFWNYHMESLRSSLGDTPTLYLHYDELTRENSGETLARICRFFDLEMGMNELQKMHQDIVVHSLRHFRASEITSLPSPTKRIWDDFMQRYEKSLSLIRRK